MIVLTRLLSFSGRERALMIKTTSLFIINLRKPSIVRKQLHNFYLLKAPWCTVWNKQTPFYTGLYFLGSWKGTNNVHRKRGDLSLSKAWKSLKTELFLHSKLPQCSILAHYTNLAVFTSKIGKAFLRRRIQKPFLPILENYYKHWVNTQSMT